jgi:uncharacterized alpha/beta hydrolase family protein
MEQQQMEQQQQQQKQKPTIVLHVGLGKKGSRKHVLTQMQLVRERNGLVVTIPAWKYIGLKSR